MICSMCCCSAALNPEVSILTSDKETGTTKERSRRESRPQDASGTLARRDARWQFAGGKDRRAECVPMRPQPRRPVRSVTCTHDLMRATATVRELISLRFAVPVMGFRLVEQCANYGLSDWLSRGRPRLGHCRSQLWPWHRRCANVDSPPLGQSP